MSAVAEFLTGPLKLRAFIAGEGLNVEMPYDDPAYIVSSPTRLWLRVTERVLERLAERSIVDDSDAKAVARQHDACLRTACERHVSTHGPGGVRGGPAIIDIGEL